MNTIKRAQTISFTYEKRVLFGMLGFLMLLSLLYVYFVTLSIAHAVEREEMVQKANVSSEEVAALERQYLSASNSFSESAAYTAGYVPVSKKLYVEKGTLSLLSNNAR